MGVAWTQESQLGPGFKRLSPFGYWKPQPVTLLISGPPLDLNRLLEVLTPNEVDFVLVGSSAAGFLGASRLTEDANCVANAPILRDSLRPLENSMRDCVSRE